MMRLPFSQAKKLLLQQFATKTCSRGLPNLSPAPLFHCRHFSSKRDKKSIIVINNVVEKKIFEEKKSTLEQTIAKDVGLQRFLQRVYGTAGTGIVSTLAIPGVTILSFPNIEPSLYFGSSLLGFGIALAGCVGLGRATYTVSDDKQSSENSTARQLSFAGIVGGMSLMLTPAACVIHSIDPTIWPKAIVLSLGTTAAATIWASTRPVDSLLSWRAPLDVGLVALITNGVVMLVAQYFFPSSGVGNMLQWVDIGGGIVLFTAMTAYETHKAVAMYRDGDPDHLGCATHVYLDFINLLVRIAEALAKLKKNE